MAWTAQSKTMKKRYCRINIWKPPGKTAQRQIPAPRRVLMRHVHGIPLLGQIKEEEVTKEGQRGVIGCAKFHRQALGHPLTFCPSQTTTLGNKSLVSQWRS